MKITCQSCQAKYTIADEKVVGKTVKIKCKKCGATIVVNGSDQAAAVPAGAYPGMGNEQPAAHSPGGGEEEDGATRVFAEGQGPGGGINEWTCNITDEDQRTLTTPQLLIEFQRGVVTADTYVWKDGMPDWLPISGIPQLVHMMGGAAPAPAPARAAAPRVEFSPQAAMPAPAPAPMQMGAAGTMQMAPPPEQEDLNATMMMPEGAAPAASPFAATPAPAAAARRGGRSGGVDLFAANQQKAEAAAPQQPAGPNAAALDRLVGERNENSVLFSISALTAAAGAASKNKEDPFDLGAAPPPRNGARGGGPAKDSGRAGMDDIMNLGGGMSAAPMLAPPPLLAPVVEAPPPPPPVAAVPAMGAYNPQAMQAPPPQSKTGLILGVVAIVIALGGVGAFFATRPSGDAKTAGDQAGTAAKTATAAPPTATTAAPVVAAPTNTGDSQASPTGTGAATNVAVAANPTDKPKVGGPLPDKKDAKADKKDAKADKKDDKKPDEKKPDEKKPDDKPKEGGGGKEFDRAAAMSALGGAAGGAKGCKQPDGPTGSGRVKVTFAPGGNVTSASVDGPPFAGTSVGGCIAAAFQSARVPPFDGSPVSVSKSFTIN